MSEIKSLNIVLDWPPSINQYWRRHGNRYFISAEGQQYRKNVIYSCYEYKQCFPKENRLRVDIEAYPPDKRRRDLDNVLKSLLDSLQHAGVYEDDCQIDKLSIIRLQPLCGKVAVTISAL